jgi:hypothetical protein
MVGNDVTETGEQPLEIASGDDGPYPRNRGRSGGVNGFDPRMGLIGAHHRRPALAGQAAIG